MSSLVLPMPNSVPLVYDELALVTLLLLMHLTEHSISSGLKLHLLSSSEFELGLRLQLSHDESRRL